MKDDLLAKAFLTDWLELHPFGGLSRATSKGRLRFAPDLGLIIEFVVRGAFDWPENQGSLGSRKNKLWEANCFECFWEKSDGGYYEFNLSPQLDWQIYEFESERKGQQESKLSLGQGSFIGRNGIDWHIQAVIPSVPALSDCARFQLANVLLLDGHRHYYAFGHPKGHPDFHKDSFWKKLSDVRL